MDKNNSVKNILKYRWLIGLLLYLVFLDPAFIFLAAMILVIFLASKKKLAKITTLSATSNITKDIESGKSVTEFEPKEKQVKTPTFTLASLINAALEKFSDASVKVGHLFVRGKKTLDRKKKYLQIALNGTLAEAESIVRILPVSDKILIEVGTPLIKHSGQAAIVSIATLCPRAYIVADTKTADMADRDVTMVAEAGANAATCLGVAPIETIDLFIIECESRGIDSMIDMMNVQQPLLVLKKLKKLPKVVILHRGVDETEQSKGKMIPYYQINQIKGSYNIMLSVAGGDSSREVQSAVFNGADIVVVWKDFIKADQGMMGIVQAFLKDIR
jgi:3-keto-L-gulonate-6-phosphate decarboxylase